MFMLPPFVLLRRIAEPISFLSPFFPPMWKRKRWIFRASASASTQKVPFPPLPLPHPWLKKPTVLCFTANVTLLLRVNDEFDGIWTSCGLRRRFRSCHGGFGFYNHSDLMTKMVWSQGGHIKRRLLYY